MHQLDSPVLWKLVHIGNRALEIRPSAKRTWKIRPKIFWQNFFSQSNDPILFVIYVTDLTDNLTIDHLLYADDVINKLIAPRKQ